MLENLASINFPHHGGVPWTPLKRGLSQTQHNSFQIIDFQNIDVQIIDFQIIDFQIVDFQIIENLKHRKSTEMKYKIVGE
jgi:hypothetical protein